LIAQFAGAFCGAVLVWIHYLPHWKNTDSEIKKLSVFCTSPAIRSIPNNLFSEILGTLVLVLAILFIGANDFTEGLKPVVVGALISMIGFSLGGTTGFAINPARDLGPRIAHFVLPIPGKGPSDWQYAWVPVVGPVIGGLLGAFIFTLLFN
jgi:glycerol uptake facilitator protein